MSLWPVYFAVFCGRVVLLVKGGLFPPPLGLSPLVWVSVLLGLCLVGGCIFGGWSGGSLPCDPLVFLLVAWFVPVLGAGSPSMSLVTSLVCPGLL